MKYKSAVLLSLAVKLALQCGILECYHVVYIVFLQDIYGPFRVVYVAQCIFKDKKFLKNNAVAI